MISVSYKFVAKDGKVYSGFLQDDFCSLEKIVRIFVVCQKDHLSSFRQVLGCFSHFSVIMFCHIFDFQFFIAPLCVFNLSFFCLYFSTKRLFVFDILKK